MTCSDSNLCSVLFVLIARIQDSTISLAKISGPKRVAKLSERMWRGAAELLNWLGAEIEESGL